MARDPDAKPRKRFTRSGHTTHQPRVAPDPAAPTAPHQYPPTAPPPYPHTAPRQYPPPHAYEPGRPGYRPTRRYDEPEPAGPTREQRYPEGHYDPRRDPYYDDRPAYRGDEYREPPHYRDERAYRDEPPHYRDPYARDPYRDDPYARDPYRDEPPPTTPVTVPLGGQVGAAGRGGRSATVTRAALQGTNRYARLVTRKVIDASKADGADRSGLTALIWNQVLSYGTDAMITVALAGTVFFGASSHAQRGNVLLYLLITMAPFAVVAPIIGPALDRLQHGRRWTMAGTAIGRAVLALVMAMHSNELLVLYPCALGSLVLSKAYAVVRAAAAPRLVPPGLTLVEANARLSIFGLASTLVLGGFIGVVIKVTGSYTLGLTITAIAFGATAWFAFKLPPQVDSANRAARHPQEPPRPKYQAKVPPLHRLRDWARRGFPDHLIPALYGESVLRYLSGMLTIYLAFYVESTSHGFQAAAELGAVVTAAGVGNFAGNAVGTRLKLSRPELVITISVVAAAAACVVVAAVYSITAAVLGMLVSATANSLSKIALDALIQRDVVETLRSSAFARSETFLQLAWVIGAAIGVILPAHSQGDGSLGFGVAAGVTAIVAVVCWLRQRAVGQARTRPWPQPPGALDPTEPRVR